MIIHDIPYLEDLKPKTEKTARLSGSSGAFVSGAALAYGDSAFAYVDADTRSKATGNGASVSLGQVTAVAYGNQYASVDVYAEAEGDITRVLEWELGPVSDNFEQGKAIAVGIDLPNSHATSTSSIKRSIRLS